MARFVSVDDYISSATDVTVPILRALRKIFLESSREIVESIKWNVPCYTCNGMVGGFAAYKNHVSWGLWKTELLHDPHGLIGKGIKRGGKICSMSEVPSQREMKALIRQVIALNQQRGRIVSKKRVSESYQPVEPMKDYSHADQYFESIKQWRDESVLLRKIILSRKLTEEMRWGKPCYSLDGANVVLIHGFKEYCALLVFKGALLKDPEKILVRQTQNVQSARQIRFTSAGQIKKLTPVLKAYIDQAVAVERSGLKVEKKKTADFPVAVEFASQLKKNRALKLAFEKLTPGRQRGYLLHFAGAKQAKTRGARIEKCIPQIMANEGLDD